MEIVKIIDLVCIFLNVILFSLFLKTQKFSIINSIIVINASRLLVGYFSTDNVWYLNHFYAVTLLLLINLFSTKKLVNWVFSLSSYFKILILIFFFIFTFKENFLIIHPGIGGWTYEGEYETYVNQENYLIKSQDDNLKLKNEIQSYFEDRKIIGFQEGYLDINEIEIANTNIGDFIINDGDFHVVFPDILFNNFNPVSLKKIKISILENTLCDRLNNKRYLINRSISYPDHAVYNKLKPQNKNCDSYLEIYEISTYKIYANIENQLYKVKKIEKINN